MTSVWSVEAPRMRTLAAPRVESKVEAGGLRLQVPSVPLEGHVLWGMTLRILDGFFERVAVR